MGSSLVNAIIGLTIVGIAGAVVRVLIRGRRDPVRWPREPVCGACGYPVAGLSALACPECGADLREVGISTPRLMRPGAGRIVGLVLANAVLCAAACFILTQALQAALLQNSKYTTISIGPRDPASVEWHAVKFDVRGDRTGAFPGRTPGTDVTLTLSMKDERMALLSASRTTGGWTRNGQVVDAAYLREWLRVPRVDTTTAPGDQLVTYLVHLLDRAATDVNIWPDAPQPDLTSSSWSNTSYGAPEWIGPAMTLAWLASTAAGTILMVTGGRRTRAEPAWEVVDGEWRQVEPAAARKA